MSRLAAELPRSMARTFLMGVGELDRYYRPGRGGVSNPPEARGCEAASLRRSCHRTVIRCPRRERDGALAAFKGRCARRPLSEVAAVRSSKRWTPRGIGIRGKSDHRAYPIAVSSVPTR